MAETRDSVLSIPIIALALRTPKQEEEQASGDTGSESIELLDQEEPEEQEGVFVVSEDNTVSFRPVKVGIAGREHFEVLEGLEEGEVIVAGSYQAIRQLEDGNLVRPRREEGTQRQTSQTQENENT